MSDQALISQMQSLQDTVLKLQSTIDTIKSPVAKNIGGKTVEFYREQRRQRSIKKVINNS